MTWKPRLEPDLFRGKNGEHDESIKSINKCTFMTWKLGLTYNPLKRSSNVIHWASEQPFRRNGIYGIRDFFGVHEINWSTTSFVPQSLEYFIAQTRLDGV